MKTLLLIAFTMVGLLPSCENRHSTDANPRDEAGKARTGVDQSQGNSPGSPGSAPHSPSEHPTAPTGAGGAAPTGSGS